MRLPRSICYRFGLVCDLKDLNSTISGIHYVHPVFRVGADTSRCMELSRLVASLAKPKQQLSFAIENFNPVEGWDIETALNIECHRIRLSRSAPIQTELPPEVPREIQNLNPVILPVEDKNFIPVDRNFNRLPEFGWAE